MTDFHELAVDLINEAKSSKDHKRKSYLLEQIREIVFHRSKVLLKDVIESVFDFMLDKSPAIKRVILKFGSDAMQLDINFAISHHLNLFQYLLSDNNDSVLVDTILDLSKHYDKMIKTISTMSIIAKGPSATDPKSMWNTMQSITSAALDFLSSSRSDRLKMACLRVCESQILFGLPAASAPVDPRLARKANDPRLARSMKKDSTSGSGNNAESIPLHHPFINRNEIQRAAEDMVSRILLWSNKGGPQGYPFSPFIMSHLGQIISNVGSSRPKNAIHCAKALIFMIQGKGNVVEQMTGTDREFLARAGHQLLRSSLGSGATDPDGTMQKLRGALGVLETLGFKDSEESESRKRGREEVETEQLLDESVESAAKKAVDEAEQTLSKRPKVTKKEELAKESVGNVLEQLNKPVNYQLQPRSVPTGETTELSGEVYSFKSTYNFKQYKMVSVPLNVPVGEEMLHAPQPPPEVEEYSDLALNSIQNLLSSFGTISGVGKKAYSSFGTMCVRTVLTLTLNITHQKQREMKKNKNIDKSKVDQLWKEAAFMECVPIFESFVTSVGAKSREEARPYVIIPRVTWLFISFFFNLLRKSERENSRHEGFSTAISTIHYKLLLQLCLALHAEYEAAVLEEEEKEQNSEQEKSEEPFLGLSSLSLKELYDDICLLIFSRFLQATETRSVTGSFLLEVPTVPGSCMATLKLLLKTGSKASTGTSSASRGTRLEAILLLGRLVFCGDHMESGWDYFKVDTEKQSTADSALLHLLHCSVVQDFEIRSNVVNLLVNDLLHTEDWCDSKVAKFALIAASTTVTQESYSRWYNGQSEKNPESIIEENKEHENPENLDDFPSLYSVFPHKEVTKHISAVPNLEDLNGEARAAYCKRALHLLSQLCVHDARALGGFIELYSVVVEVEAIASSDEVILKKEEETKAETKKPWSLSEYIKLELKEIIPAVSQSHTVESTFDALIGTSGSLLRRLAKGESRSLVEYALHLLLPDHTVPATPTLVAKVMDFISDSETSPLPLATEKITKGNDSTSMEVEEDSGTVSDTPAQMTKVQMTKIASDDDFRLALAVVSGFKASDIEAGLPRAVNLLSDAEQLRVFFSRITKARPPPMTKATLLIALHRIDFEKHGLKAKSVLDAIAICLNNKSDYSSEVIKEVLKALLSDENPPYALMRTAILSAQSFSEVKRFVLSDVIPALIQKQVWKNAPKLWEGVVYGAKNLAATGFKNSEYTLRALLGIPGPQLKSLLKIAANVKAPLSKMLKELSEEEKGDVVSGRANGIITGEEEGTDSDKEKIIKELLAIST